MEKIYKAFINKFMELIKKDDEFFLYQALEETVSMDWDDLEENQPETIEEAEKLAEDIYNKNRIELLQYQSEQLSDLEWEYIDTFVDRFFSKIDEKLYKNLSDKQVEAIAQKAWDKNDSIPTDENEAQDMAVADFDMLKDEIIKNLTE